MTAVLFDLDGVLYQKGEAIAGASETVAWFQGRKIPHLFITNTTSKPRTALVKKLAGFGIKIDASRILTPALAALHWLKEHPRDKPTALFVPKATREEFAGLDLLPDSADSGAGAVIVGDFGEGWDFHTLNRAFRLLIDQTKPAFIALGMTRYWLASDGLRLDTAPFVVALQHASGTQPLVLGKPAAPFFQTALEMVGEPASNTVMIGDDIRSDIGGAQQIGIRGVLVRTGKFRPTDLNQDLEPAAVIDSVADLPAWWKKDAGL